MKRFTKHMLPFLISAAMLSSLTGCTTPPASEPLETVGVYFDTIISIKIWGGSQDILDHCREMCSDYEQLFSRTIDTSDISRINAAHGQPVEVDDETIELIEKGLYYSQLSGGRFDITIAPLSELWDIKNNPGSIPDEAAIEEAVSHIDYRNVLVEGNTVTLKDPKAAIDLGGIAKGFIADKLKAWLKSEGIENGQIDLGGNLLTIGSKTDGSDFHIGIQKPFAETNEAITTVDIHDQSVVSSGIYERYFKKDGKIYHHLLDPETGYPFDNHLLQVTIISDQSVDGDGLSTACFALGLEQGSQLVESLDGIRAIFVTDDYSLHYVN